MITENNHMYFPFPSAAIITIESNIGYESFYIFD